MKKTMRKRWLMFFALLAMCMLAVPCVSAQAKTAAQTEKSGKLRRGWHTTASGKKFWVCRDGTRAVGWKRLHYQYYYFRKNGILYEKRGWFKEGGSTYYIKKDATRVANCLYNIEKKKYYFDAEGRLVTNVRAIKFDSRYFNIDANGVMSRISELEALCEQETQKFISRHTSPGTSNAEKFRRCFSYLLAYMDYWPQPFNRAEFEPEEWYYTKAISIFRSPTLRGNCYSFACAVASCAKELGYDPYVIVTTGDHGFVTIDGRYYDNMYGGQFGTSSHRPYTIYKKVHF